LHPSANFSAERLPVQGLYAAVARSQGLDAGRVVVGNGSTEVLNWAVLAFASPSRPLVAMHPEASTAATPATGKVPDDPAAQVQLALDQFRAVLAAAGLDFRHVAFVNPYLTGELPMNAMNSVYAKHFEFGNTPARATIQVASLPHGARIGFTGVAATDLAKRRAVRPKNMAPSATASPCVWAGDTYYCSAKAGFIPGPNSGIWAAEVENQVRQTMRNLLDGLEEAGLDFSHVVASNVYLDNMDEFARMNGVYAQYFGAVPPTRTTVSPKAPVERKPDAQGRWPKLEEISIVAVK
jgi:enamine deaminase RidA (YjgF/YER057c/UK114 family)